MSPPSAVGLAAKPGPTDLNTFIPTPEASGISDGISLRRRVGDTFGGV